LRLHHALHLLREREGLVPSDVAIRQQVKVHAAAAGQLLLQLQHAAWRCGLCRRQQLPVVVVLLQQQVVRGVLAAP
jgi:hypothetical protein